jgi:hypothetical protein
MIERGASAQGRDAQHTIVMVLLAAGSGSWFAWLGWRDNLLGSLSDGAIYVVMANLFSPWHSSANALSVELFRDYPFPPLYPLVLGLLGGGSGDVLISFVITAATLVAATLAIYSWNLRILSRQLDALVLTLGFVLLPATMFSAMNLQSESLYIAVTFSALALIGGQQKAFTRAAALIGLSVLARTAGVGLVLAALVYGVRRRPVTRWPWLVFLLLAPGVGWHLTRQAVGGSGGYLDSMSGNSIGTAVSATFGYIMLNAAALPGALFEVFSLHESMYIGLVLAALTSCAAFGLLTRLRAGELDALYALFYFAIVIVWPYPEHLPRFLLVIMPMYFAYAWLGCRALAERVGAREQRWFVLTTFALLLGAITLPGTFSIANPIIAAEDSSAKYVRSPMWYTLPSSDIALDRMRRVEQIAESMRGVAEHVPANACVSSAAYAFIPFYGQRKTIAVAPMRMSNGTFNGGLGQCPYVFMLAATQAPGSDYPAMYPYHRIKERMDVIEVKLWDQDALEGDVLTMLARVRSSSGNDDSNGQEHADSP